jgi:phage-related protein
MRREPILQVAFYASQGGREPVRDWLREIDRPDRQTIGTDLKTVQFGWPMGMPLIRKLDADLWETRSRLRDGIARVVFTVEGNTMVILHAFIKRSTKTPEVELDVARRRLARLKGRPR